MDKETNSQWIKDIEKRQPDHFNFWYLAGEDTIGSEASVFYIDH